MTALTAGRIGIAAQAIGILAACLDESVAFAKERVAFGKPIGAFEGVSFKIAQMAMDLDAARLLDVPCGGTGRRWPSRSRSRRARRSCSPRLPRASTRPRHCRFTAVTATPTSFAVERHYRDAKITEIYEGTSEIQQVIIARSLLGRLD